MNFKKLNNTNKLALKIKCKKVEKIIYKIYNLRSKYRIEIYKICKKLNIKYSDFIKYYQKNYDGYIEQGDLK